LIQFNRLHARAQGTLKSLSNHTLLQHTLSMKGKQVAAKATLI